MRIPQIAILSIALLFTSGASMSAPGQGVGTPGTIPPKPTRTSPGAVRTVYKTEVRIVTPTTGSLSVAANSNANLLVENLSTKKALGQKGIVPAGEGGFIFNDLKPGKYRVAGTLAGYHPTEKQITIKANENHFLTLDFLPVLFSLTINTNVSTGELRYRPDGQSLTNVTPIVNGKVQLSLPLGKYALEVKPGQFGYETRSQTVELDKHQVLDMTLKNFLSRDTLSPIWSKEGLQEWDIPAGWQDSKRSLLVKGPGVALPREQGYRFYKDFKLESSVKMVNAVALSFALRAQDSRNYYLLQLTGAKSDDPHMLRLYILKNGVERRIKAVPIPGSVAGPMDAGQFFTVTIKVIGNEITVAVVNSQTGEPYLLGTLTDPDRNFEVGAVGIAARNNEENVIERFIVCTGDKCLNE